MKFSRGEFKNKAIIKAKTSSGKYTIYTTAEYANESIKQKLLNEDQTLSRKAKKNLLKIKKTI